MNGASTVTISIKEYQNHAPDTVKWTLPSGAQIQPGEQSGGYRASRMVNLSFISENRGIVFLLHMHLGYTNKMIRDYNALKVSVHVRIKKGDRI